MILQYVCSIPKYLDFDRTFNSEVGCKTPKNVNNEKKVATVKHFKINRVVKYTMRRFQIMYIFYGIFLQIECYPETD